MFARPAGNRGEEEAAHGFPQRQAAPPLIEVPIAGTPPIPTGLQRRLEGTSQGRRRDIPPEDWIPEELIRYGVVGTQNVRPADLTGVPHTIFDRSRFLGSDDRRFGAMSQSLLLASTLLEIGMPYLASWLPEPNFADGLNPRVDPNRLYDRVNIRPNPTDDDIEVARNELLEIATGVQFWEDPQMYRGRGWLGITSSCYPRVTENFGLNVVVPTEASDWEIREEGLTRRPVTIGIASEHIDVLLNSERDSEEHLCAAFYLAVTLVHEIAHLVYWQDLRNVMDMMGLEPAVDDQSHREIGFAFITWLFGGWNPNPIIPEGSGSLFNHGMFWRKQISYGFRPRWVMRYSMPFAFIQRLMSQSTWDPWLGNLRHPNVKAILRAPAPFSYGQHARTAVNEKRRGANPTMWYWKRQKGMTWRFDENEDDDEDFGGTPPDIPPFGFDDEDWTAGPEAEVYPQFRPAGPGPSFQPLGHPGRSSEDLEDTEGEIPGRFHPEAQRQPETREQRQVNLEARMREEIRELRLVEPMEFGDIGDPIFADQGPFDSRPVSSQPSGRSGQSSENLDITEGEILRRLHPETQREEEIVNLTDIDDPNFTDPGPSASRPAAPRPAAPRPVASQPSPPRIRINVIYSGVYDEVTEAIHLPANQAGDPSGADIANWPEGVLRSLCAQHDISSLGDRNELVARLRRANVAGADQVGPGAPGPDPARLTYDLPSATTLDAFKQMVARDTGIPAARQRFMLGNEELRPRRGRDNTLKPWSQRPGWDSIRLHRIQRAPQRDPGPLRQPAAAPAYIRNLAPIPASNALDDVPFDPARQTWEQHVGAYAQDVARLEEANRALRLELAREDRDGAGAEFVSYMDLLDVIGVVLRRRRALRRGLDPDAEEARFQREQQ